MTNIINTVHTRNRPMPELFTRHDIRNSGGWDVAPARAVRGEPFITVSGRIMRVPLDDSDLARAIRGHEQVHCKVSPQDLSVYITDVTGESAIRSAEEARVNLIASMLGFPMKSLVTGSETFDGETVAKTLSWPEAVYAVAACVHTGSLNPFLTGVRRVNRAWADSLKLIAAEIVKFQNRQLQKLGKTLATGETRRRPAPDVILKAYGSTETHRRATTLKGMDFSIELALMLESIAATPAPTAQEPSKDKKITEETGDEGGFHNSKEPTKGARDLKENSTNLNRKAIQEIASKVMSNGIGTYGVGEWMPVNPTRTRMSIGVPGAIGRKRVPSNMGRNPRRMHRLITDPNKRIFDTFVKAVGGVVLIDCSGSMALSKSALTDIMLAAPGCTIIGYGNDGVAGKHDTFILAEKGRICDELPKFPYGNGNDLPALQYALTHRQNRKTPVIWVTDGLVYFGRKSACNEYAQRECAEYAQKNGVHMEYSPSGAVAFLRNLQQGRPYTPRILPRWKSLLRAAA